MRSIKSKNYGSWEDRPLYHRWLFLFQRKLLGALMQRGLRAKNHCRLQASLQLLKRRQGVAPSTILLAAFLRISPEVQLKGSGSRLYVSPVSEHQRISLAVRWLLGPLKITSKRRTVNPRRLVDAVEEALHNRGSAVAEKKKLYQQAILHKHQTLPYKYT